MTRIRRKDSVKKGRGYGGQKDEAKGGEGEGVGKGRRGDKKGESVTNHCTKREGGRKGEEKGG